MTYQLLATKNVIADNGVQYVAVVNTTELLLKLTTKNSFVSGYEFERSFNSGSTFKVRWVQNGLNGRFVSIGFGETELLFDVADPLSPYEIEILPKRLIYSYTLEVFKLVPNPRFDVLSERLGIPVSLLKNIPQQTLLVLEGLNLMASTDILGILENMEAVQEQATQTDNNLALQAASLNHIRTNGVQSKEFILLQSDFTLDNGAWKAPIVHNMYNRFPSASKFDNSGNEQLIQFTGVTSLMGFLELTATQYADNDFPLTVVLQGKIGEMPARQGVNIGGGVYFSLLGGDLAKLNAGGTAYESIATNVTAAKYRNGRVVYIVGGNAAVPYIASPGNGFVPNTGSSGDWSPDEDNSPSVPA